MSCDHGAGAESFVLDLTINLELPGGWIIAAPVLRAFSEILGRLERDGIRPYRTSIEVTETPTR